jgi:hypothetical protein
MIDVGYCTLCDAPLAVDALTCAACGGKVPSENDQDEGK